MKLGEWLFLILLTLKLCGKIDCSWFIVCLPLLLKIVLGFLAVVLESDEARTRRLWNKHVSKK